MMIPEHKIEEVLERVDLVQLVSRHVELKKAGRSFKGRCPFHQEKSASFHVTPEMRRFKCFGCQAGGDAIAFVQRYLGKTFVDAVTDLAREVGVDLESAQDPTAKERNELKQATDYAAEHFKARLWHPAHGAKAREYLAGRGLPEEIIRAFGLGVAASEWSDLADALDKRGMADWGIKAGLVARRQKGDGHYDMFRGRLIIPIRSPEGRTIAFGGRLLEASDGPKYLNSRESRLYNKSETLYGMDLAREEIRRRKSAVLVEGYFDCIGLHQAGVKNTVALCSTALTPGHLGLLSRMDAKELVLLLDGDDAGRKAVERLAGPILASGTAAKVAVLPQDEDPDTFARKVGEAGVRKLLDEARALTDHLFHTVLPDGARSTFEAKMQALARLKPVTTALPVGLVRSAFFSAMSQHFGLPASELETELRGKLQPLQPVPKPTQPGVRAPSSPPAREKPPDVVEAMFVALAAKHPRLLSQDPFRIQDELLHGGLRALMSQLSARVDASEALFEASEPVKNAVEQAFRQVPEDPGAAEGSFHLVARKLKLRRIDEQLHHIAAVTGKMGAASELDDETRRLQAERIELLALRKRVIQEGSVGVTGTNKTTQPV